MMNSYYYAYHIFEIFLLSTCLLLPKCTSRITDGSTTTSTLKIMDYLEQLIYKKFI